MNSSDKLGYFNVTKKGSVLSSNIDFSSRKADRLYGANGVSQIGYSVLVAVVTKLDYSPVFINMVFDSSLIVNTGIVDIYL